MRHLFSHLFFAATLLFGSSSLAFAQGSPKAMPVLASATALATTEAAAHTTIVLTGRVEAPNGVVVGAVVGLRDNDLAKAVTGADGTFSLTVPVTKTPVPVVVSYAGYNDEATVLIPQNQTDVVRLLVPHEIKVPRNQQLPAYLRHARKEVKHELRELHRKG